MFKKNKDRIGISLVDDCLKIAHVRIAAQEHKVIAVAKKDVKDVPTEDLPRVIRDLLLENGLKNPSAVCAVSSSMVTTKNIEVPSVDPAEIRSIIDLQAGRHTPFSREEIMISYVTIGVFQRNYTKILLIIVNRGQILKQVNAMTAAGIRVEKVVLAPEAQSMFYAQALNIKEDQKPVGIMDVSYHSTDFMMLGNQKVITSRSIPVGMTQLIKEGTPARDKLITELMQSQEAYQSEEIGQPPEMFLLTSDDAKIQELQPVLQEKLKTNVKLQPYLDHIQADQPVMLKLVSEYNDDSFLDVIAAATMADALSVDLTPPEIITQRAIEEQGKQVIYAGIAVLVIIALVVGKQFSTIYFRNIYLERLKAEYEEKQKIVTALNQISQKTRILKDYMTDRLVSLEILKTLYELVPEEMYLQSVTLNDLGTIDIAGTSESMSRVFDLVSALEDTVLFKNVKTKSTSAKKERGKDVAVFEITFRLESAPDEVPEDEKKDEKVDVEKAIEEIKAKG